MHTHLDGAPRARRWLRSVTALALPVTTLALVGFGDPAMAANPAEDCVLSGDAFACTLTYTYTGAEQSLLVPGGVTSVDVEAIGAAGANYSDATPGRGAKVSGSVDVTPGATYYVEVGGIGSTFNGGGVAGAGARGGGGATDLRSVSSASTGSLDSRLVVAGGGGGTDLNGSNGGDAGLVGAPGVPGGGSNSGGGQGGTQTAGGAAGANASVPGTPGSLGRGGQGGSNYGGGGGGGLYGGGGAGGSTTGVGSGGGGGSSLVPASGTVVVNPAIGNGSLTVTYTSPITGSELAIGAPSVAAGVDNPVTMTVTDGTATATVTPDTLTIAPNGGTSGASCSANACSATEIGTYTATGTYAGHTQQVSFSVVAGSAASIELTPADTTVAAGTQAPYTVTGTDEFGNDLGDITGASLVTTSGPAGTNIACPQGVCKVETVGDYTVDASTPGAGGGAVTASADLHVNAAGLAAIALSPRSATVTSGQAQAYAAAGRDRFGNDLGDVTEDAEISAVPIGGGATTVCDAASCSPTADGTYVVTADVGGVTGTATLVVRALASTVSVEPVSGVVFGDDVLVAATVTSPGGTPTGTVQFSLDGSDLGDPVALDADGAATLPDVEGVHAGVHTLRASYASEDGAFTRDDDVAAFLVEKAPTTTGVTAAPGTLSATVTGAGEPTGTVDFYVDGVEVGSAELDNGTAVLEGTSNDGGSVVGASYGGDADHAASSASTSRKSPRVTPRASGPGRSGWYSGPVTVSFTCSADATSCPAPVVLDQEGAGQYVTRTVVGADGGVTTVTAGPYSLDLTAPTVAASRVGDGKTYKGRARIATCSGSDVLSGLVSCAVTTTGGPFGAMTSTLTATDVAGNTTSRTAAYRVLGVWVARAKRDGTTWAVRRGHRRVLHVMSTRAPRLKHSGAVNASDFTMAGRRGGITHWVATVTPRSSLSSGRKVSLRLRSSQGAQTVRLGITK